MLHARAALRIWQVRRGLREAGFEASLARWLRPRQTANPMAPMRNHAADWARAVHRLGSRWPHSRCLDQSLALASLLRERGSSATLVIGADRQGGQVMAHAWVEVDGVALGESTDLHARFRILDRWPKETR